MTLFKPGDRVRFTPFLSTDASTGIVVDTEYPADPNLRPRVVIAEDGGGTAYAPIHHVTKLED